jgi:uroporphyrinogen decarboxylase
VATSWSSRERVLAAVRHQEPDRVPMALWGSYYTLQDQTYFSLLQHLGLGEPVPPFRRLKGHNSNYYDDRVLDALDTDIRYVWLGFTDLGGPQPDTGLDAWGVRWQRVGPYMTPVAYPLAAATLDDLEQYPWPDVEALIRLDELRERLAALRRDGRHAIAARAVASYGPFEQAQAMRGREQFLVDLVEQPAFAEALIGRITAVLMRLLEIYLDVAGPDIDIMELPGDDYGGTTNLLISPRAFARFVKPALAGLAGQVKSCRSEIAVAFHSDGAIAPLLQSFIDIGIDIFHPLEPLPANDHAALKARYGDRLTFMGAIDIKTAMPGSIADVEDEVARRIQLLGRGGGYILAPANHLGDVPPENIVALYRAAAAASRGMRPLPAAG